MQLEHNHDGTAGRAGCPACNQELATAGFEGRVPAGPGEARVLVTCPECGRQFPLTEDERQAIYRADQAIRMTESVEAPEAPADELAEAEAALTDAERAAEAAAKANATKPYGNVSYADPGYLDGAGTQVSDTGLTPVARYALDSAKRVRAAWSYINQADNAAQYTASQLKLVKGRIRAAAAKFGVKTAGATEAMIDGTRSFDDVRELVRAALVEREREESGEFYAYCYVADMTDAQVVYSCGGKDDLYQCAYSLDDAGTVTLGEPQQVVRTYTPAPAAMSTGEATPPTEQTPKAVAPQIPADEAGRQVSFDGRLVESGDHIEGQLLAAKGNDDAGGRVFGVRIIAYGDSKNGRRYPEAVMRAAVPLYEGAKAYDHHRTEAELRTSTITGLVG